MKIEICQSLCTLNELFQLASEHLDKLQSAGIIPPEFAEIRKAAAGQLRAEINCKVIDALSIPEADEAASFERLRIELETKQKGVTE